MYVKENEKLLMAIFGNMQNKLLSTSGQGRQILNLETWVQFPLGVPMRFLNRAEKR